MTNEKMEMISKVLMDNKEEMLSLLGMEPTQVAEALNAKGCEVSTEEMIEYAKRMDEIKKKAEDNNGELDEDSLDEVAGGGLVTTALVGVAVGYWLYGQKW